MWIIRTTSYITVKSFALSNWWLSTTASWLTCFTTALQQLRPVHHFSARIVSLWQPLVQNLLFHPILCTVSCLFLLFQPMLDIVSSLIHSHPYFTLTLASLHWLFLTAILHLFPRSLSQASRDRSWLLLPLKLRLLTSTQSATNQQPPAAAVWS